MEAENAESAGADAVSSRRARFHGEHSGAVGRRLDMQGVPDYDKVTGDTIPTPHGYLPDGSARPTEPWESTAGYP